MQWRRIESGKVVRSFHSIVRNGSVAFRGTYKVNHLVVEGEYCTSALLLTALRTLSFLSLSIQSK
jgi:hypothetical protein